MTRDLLLRCSLIAAVLFGLSDHVLQAQCDTMFEKLTVRCEPATIGIEGSGTLVVEGSGIVSPAIKDLARVYVGTTEATVIGVTAKSISFTLPAQTPIGDVTISFCISDGPWGRALATVVAKRALLDTAVNSFDPDPTTQNGPPVDLSRTPRIVEREPSVTNPPGGYGWPTDLACDSMHTIDGLFTRSRPGRPQEWEGITPLLGRFSKLYLDYCPKSQIMYLMNDWGIGNGPYEKTCYNVFGFSTGNGRENWKIKVNHDTARPVVVELNGKDVTDDTAIVVGVRFGFSTSPCHGTTHTIYEFGIKASVGLFFMEIGSDPVERTPSTTVALDCKDDGTGLIQEPYYRQAMLTENGTVTRQDQRYIPTSGIVGLTTEPSAFSGVLRNDTCVIRYGSGDSIRNACSGVMDIDGDFTSGEWPGTLMPARGRYSYLYAQYCNGRLHILNDWVLATTQPSNATCYNLFELFTGNGSEHWGIYVYQDSAKGVRVFRNGVDVSDSAAIVMHGASSFGTSPNALEQHTKYEFAIAAAEGAWKLFLADPGPSSTCTNQPVSVQEPDVADAQISIYPNPAGSDEDLVLDGLRTGDDVRIMALDGSVVRTFTVDADGVTRLDLARWASGLYHVRVQRGAGVFVKPLVICR